MIGLDRDLHDLAFIKLGHEITENHFIFRRVSRNAEQVEQQDHEEADHYPEQQVLNA